jgi:hypothetical protein
VNWSITWKHWPRAMTRILQHLATVALFIALLYFGLLFLGWLFPVLVKLIKS